MEEPIEPLLVVDRRTGEPIPRLRVLGEDGEPVPSRAFDFALGPGADTITRARFEAQDDAD